MRFVESAPFAVGLGAALLVMLGAMFGPTSASAQAAEALLERHAELDRELARRPSAARERRLVRLLDQTVDHAMIVHRVLVVHWGERSEEERETARDLLTRAVRHRYRASVASLHGWDVEVVSDEPRGVGRRVVTRARRGDEVRNVSYDLYLDEGQWRVVDLIIEGDSLVHQYRVQFDRVIRHEGWNGFIERLRRRVEADES